MALATAKLFVEEGAYVFITGRRQDRLDSAVKAISKNVTGVLSDASNLSDLDRLYEIVKKEKGKKTGRKVASVTGATNGIYEKRSDAWNHCRRFVSSFPQPKKCR